MNRPPAVAHVGMTVTDLDRAVRWYGDVLDLEAIGGPVEVREHDGHGGAVAADVFGARFGRFRQAHLASSNGVALELFEFHDPPVQRRPDAFEYRLTGISHVCLSAPDLGRLADQIGSSGGRRRTRVWEIFAGEPYRTCFCEDPDGNVIELYSHSHERTYANRRG